MSGWKAKGARSPEALLKRARRAVESTGPVMAVMQRELKATVQQNVTAQRYGDGAPWPPRKRRVRGRIKMLLRVPRNIEYLKRTARRGVGGRIWVVARDAKAHYKYQLKYGAPSRNLPVRSPFPRGTGAEAFKAIFGAWLASRLDQTIKG